MAGPKKTDVWMPLYIGDYLADTLDLSTEAHGAYLLLLMRQWMKGPIPDDDEKLAAITKLPIDRWMHIRGLLLGYFWVSSGFWESKRGTEEKTKADAFLRKQITNGSKGGRPKKPKNPNETQTKPNTEPKVKAKHNPSETPSPSHTTELSKDSCSSRVSASTAFASFDDDSETDPGQPTSTVVQLDPFKRWRMFPAWRPDPTRLSDVCKAQGFDQGQITPDVITEFATHFSGYPSEFSEVQWIGKLIKAAKRMLAIGMTTTPSAKSSQSFIDRITDRSWADGL